MFKRILKFINLFLSTSTLWVNLKGYSWKECWDISEDIYGRVESYKNR